MVSSAVFCSGTCPQLCGRLSLLDLLYLYVYRDVLSTIIWTLGGCGCLSMVSLGGRLGRFCGTACLNIMLFRSRFSSMRRFGIDKDGPLVWFVSYYVATIAQGGNFRRSLFWNLFVGQKWRYWGVTGYLVIRDNGSRRSLS
jgi:hypothetical protein